MGGPTLEERCSRRLPLLNEVEDGLHPFRHPVFGFNRRSLISLDDPSLESVYAALQQQPSLHAHRPSLPERGDHAVWSTYKKGMAEYLLTCGIIISDPTAHAIPLYEAIANYLEQKPYIPELVPSHLLVAMYPQGRRAQR